MSKTHPPKAPNHLDVYLHIVEGGAGSDPRLDAILQQLGILQKAVTHMAADITSIKQLVTEIDAETNTLGAKVDAQTAEIARLSALVAAGGTVTQEDLDAIQAGLEPISARLKTLGADPADPVPTERKSKS